MDTRKRLTRLALMVTLLVLGPVVILGQIIAVLALEFVVFGLQQYLRLRPPLRGKSPLVQIEPVADLAN